MTTQQTRTIDTAAYAQAIQEAWQLAQQLTRQVIRVSQAAPSPPGGRQIGKAPWQPEDDFVRDFQHLSLLLSSRLGGEATRLGLSLDWCIPADRAAPTTD